MGIPRTSVEMYHKYKDIIRDEEAAMYAQDLPRTAETRKTELGCFEKRRV